MLQFTVLFVVALVYLLSRYLNN